MSFKISVFLLKYNFTLLPRVLLNSALFIANWLTMPSFCRLEIVTDLYQYIQYIFTFTMTIQGLHTNSLDSLDTGFVFVFRTGPVPSSFAQCVMRIQTDHKSIATTDSYDYNKETTLSELQLTTTINLAINQQ